MISPTEVRIDRAAGAGYVYYRHLAAGERVARTERVGEAVVADFDSNGTLLGVEVLALDDDAVRSARTFAEEHGYAFPRDLGDAHNRAPRG